MLTGRRYHNGKQDTKYGLINRKRNSFSLWLLYALKMHFKNINDASRHNSLKSIEQNTNALVKGNTEVSSDW
jgi:hypothetical protein